MPSFHVIISGHIDRTRRPDELPEVCQQVWVDEVSHPQELVERVEGRMKMILEHGGMLARLKPFEGMEVGKFDKRVWVPMHMITYFDTTIKGITGDVPQSNPDIPGEFVDGQGNKVGVQ